MSGAADNETFELPLFPLQTVLFPGGSLALKIFEPRYLDMVARCLRGENRFGVIAISRGSEVGAAETFSVGTSAEILDWHQEPGGLLGVAAIGRRSFRLQGAERRPDGLYVGRAVWLDRSATGPLPDEFRALGKLVRKASPATADPLFDDAEWVGFRLAEALPVAIPVKQSLLELSEPLERLERLAAILRNGRPAE